MSESKKETVANDKSPKANQAAVAKKDEKPKTPVINTSNYLISSSIYRFRNYLYFLGILQFSIRVSFKKF